MSSARQANRDALQHMRTAIRDAKHVATVAEFGPRFLHSTGQAYKGGPNSGVFLQITADDAADLAVPGERYTFSVVKAAQARGDFDVLIERGRRALRIHLGSDVGAGLARVSQASRSRAGLTLTPPLEGGAGRGVSPPPAHFVAAYPSPVPSLKGRGAETTETDPCRSVSSASAGWAATSRCA